MWAIRVLAFALAPSAPAAPSLAVPLFPSRRFRRRQEQACDLTRKLPANAGKISPIRADLRPPQDPMSAACAATRIRSAIAGSLKLEHLGVATVIGEQGLVRAGFDDLAFLQDDDAVSHAHSREAVRN